MCDLAQLQAGDELHTLRLCASKVSSAMNRLNVVKVCGLPSSTRLFLFPACLPPVTVTALEKAAPPEIEPAAESARGASSVAFTPERRHLPAPSPMCRRSGRPGYKEKRNAGIGVTRQLGDEADLDALCLHGLNPLMPRSVRRVLRQSEPLDRLLP
jgi:hypothetical protein